MICLGKTWLFLPHSTVQLMFYFIAERYFDLGYLLAYGASFKRTSFCTLNADEYWEWDFMAMSINKAKFSLLWIFGLRYFLKKHTTQFIEINMHTLYKQILKYITLKCRAKQQVHFSAALTNNIALLSYGFPPVQFSRWEWMEIPVWGRNCWNRSLHGSISNLCDSADWLSVVTL